MTDDASAAYSADEKLRWEIEKLRAEVDAMRRAPYKNPSYVLTGLTAIAALIGVGVQYEKSDRAYTLAQIQRAQATLDIEQLKGQRREADSVLAGVQRSIAELTSRREEEQRKLAAAADSLDAARRALNVAMSGGAVSPGTPTGATSAASAANNARVTAALNSVASIVNDVNASSAAAVRESRATFDRVQDLRTQVSPPEPSRSAAAAAAEREGFEALARGDLDAALQAFQRSEDAYHGYHSSYEIAGMLRKRRAQFGDPGAVRAVMAEIVACCLGRAPGELRAALTARARP